jgi:ParB/RepB/Spo0J family partition protein
MKPPVAPHSPAVPEFAAVLEFVPVDKFTGVNIRTLVKDDAFAGLVASVRSLGVLEPLIGRRMPSGGVELVAGFRRMAAARDAGLSVVPVRMLSQAMSTEVIAYAENEHRRPLAPLEEARALDAMLAALKDIDAVAATVGRPRAHVYRRLRLLSLIDPVASALEAEALTAAHAELIAAVPESKQRAAWEACYLPALLPGGNLEEAQPPELAAALAPVTKLRQWLEQQVRVDVNSTDVAAYHGHLLEDATPVTAAAGAAAEEQPWDPRELPQLTSDSFYKATLGAEAAAGLVGPSRWVEVVDNPCRWVEKAVLVHGETPRLLSVCMAKKECRRHFPAKSVPAKAAAAVSPKEQARRDREQAKADAAAVEIRLWGKVHDRVMRDLRDHLVSRRYPVTPSLLKLIVTVGFSTNAIQAARVPINHRTMGAVLALGSVRGFASSMARQSVRRLGKPAAAAFEKSLAVHMAAAREAEARKSKPAEAKA